MTTLSILCFALAIAFFYLDLSSRNGILFGASGRSLLLQLRLFGMSAIRSQIAYQIWIGFVVLTSLLIWGFAGSLIFASLTFISGVWGGVIFLQRVVARKLVGFESEFLRFIQLLKSDYHLRNSLSSSISQTIKKIRQTDMGRQNGRSCMSLFLDRIRDSIQNNEDLVAAFRNARSDLIMGSGIQIKSINLFISFMSSIQDTGNAGRAFDTLERRIESDLAIGAELTAVTSGAKFQMGVLALVPIVVLILFAFLMPDMVGEMFKTTFGQSLISAGSIMTLAAVWLTQKILNVKV